MNSSAMATSLSSPPLLFPLLTSLFPHHCRPLQAWRSEPALMLNRNLVSMSKSRRKTVVYAVNESTEEELKNVVEVDRLIDVLREANPAELQKRVAENVLAFNEGFWMRLATRTETCQSEDDRKDYEELSETLMKTVDLFVQKTDEKIESATDVLKSILKYVVDEGEEALWPPKDPHALDLLEKELIQREQEGYLDEGFLSEVNAQLRQAREDGDKPGLQAMLQKVLQLYAARTLSKRSYAKKAPEDQWHKLLIEGLNVGTGDVSPNEFDAVIKKRIERTLMRTAMITLSKFGTTNCVGHDRGVNWAAFHPSLPLIVSGADDRQLKLWRMNVKKTPLPIATDAIFYAGTGNLLCRGEDRVVTFDLQQRIVLGEFQAPFVNKKLVHLCTLHETIRVKIGAWDENGVFIYTTLNHIKYCLPNGDCGIIKTLDVPVYITKVSGTTVFCLDHDGKNKAIVIDATEYIFKLALLTKRYDHAMNMIRSSKLVGQAVIAYLQQKGFPEVALHFVKDEKTQINLALESGNIQTAAASTKEIDDKITGTDWEWKLVAKFHNALYLGDVCERVKILENSGHLPLAYITASVHGLHDIAERLAAELGDQVPSLPVGKSTFPSDTSSSCFMWRQLALVERHQGHFRRWI
ncbi:Coatomer subunit alpha-1-like protein [Drosera capensis]